MALLTSRRGLVSAAVFCGAAMSARAQGGSLAALEARHGGRLGVVALDTGSERRVAYRADERFPMCSTWKLLAAAAALHAVDSGTLALDRRVSYGRADLLAYAPIAAKHVDAGYMTVEELAEASVAWSDNTAANLLLGLIGRPRGWTRYAAALGDSVSRLDRTEPMLNTAIPGDPRDTTTPNAMVHDLHAVLLGHALSEASRERLRGWLLGNTITGTLLRGGLPRDWRAGDKSGAGGNGTRNDIGVISRPGAAPILIAAYYTGSKEPVASRDAVIAEVGRIVAGALA